MLAFLIRRAVFAVVALFGASLVIFTLSRIAGDPRYLYLTESNVGGAFSYEDRWEALGREFGLDKPLPVQYGLWIGKFLKGDWGESVRSGKPAVKVVMQKIPATLQLASATFMLVLVTAVPLGVFSAVKRGTIPDYIARAAAGFGQALPPFWLGIMLMLLFSVQLGWLPTSQRGGIDHYILPMVTLGWLRWSGMLRLVRSSMLNVLDSEYVKLARAKGVSTTRVVWKHAFRNALIAPLTFSALMAASYLTGTVVTETVFAWPGLGKLAVEAVTQNDFPVMAGAVLMFVVMYLVITLVLDLAYAVVDPRIRLG